jgi:hypothetical protein
MALFLIGKGAIPRAQNKTGYGLQLSQLERACIDSYSLESRDPVFVRTW